MYGHYSKVVYKMYLQKDDIIAVRHYSGLSPFKSIIMEVDESTVTVKLTKEFALMNFLVGDPVVFGYESGEDIYIYGSIIEEIDVSKNIVKLKIDKVDIEANRRKAERYPVSLYADIKLRESGKKYLATIKDISYYGMLVYTKAELEIGELLDVAIYMEKSMVFFNTNIIRKNIGPSFYEYGLGIIYTDTNSLNLMKEYLKRLQAEHEDAIRKLKNIK